MSKTAPGSESLEYKPARVAWATAHFIAQPPAVASRVFLYSLIVFIAVALVYSGFAQTAISVDARGKLATKASVLPVRAQFGMTIAKLGVTENQRVKKGDLLLESEDRVSDEEYQLIAGQREKLKGFIAGEKAGDCKGCLAAVRSFSQGAFQLDNKGYIREQLAEVRQLLLDYVTQYDQTESFGSATMSARRRIQIANAKLAEIKRRNAEQLLAQQVEALTNEVVSAQSELNDRKQAQDKGLTNARNRLEVRLDGIMDTMELYRTQNIVKAPIDGVVASLAVGGPGQVVQQGQLLMEIIPVDSGLAAELYVANKDIAQVKSGLKVRVKLDALPEREYGAVDGVVQSVGASALSDPQAGQTYRVLVALDRQSLMKGEIEYPFKAGMTLGGIIVTRYESLLMIGLKKVFNLKDALVDG